MASPSIFSIMVPAFTLLPALSSGPPEITSAIFKPVPVKVSSYNTPSTAVTSALALRGL